MDIERESIQFDVLFVGGGVSSLAGAIRLMQLAEEKSMPLEVAVIEKGAEIGAHSISGAVMNPVALRELLPDFDASGCPIEQTVSGDGFYFLTRRKAYRMPMVPRQMHNQGHFIISQAKFARWLGEIAEEMGVNIFPGFSGQEILYEKDGKTVAGVRTGDNGLDVDGARKNNFEPGIDIEARVTVFGEGARGSLTKILIEQHGLGRQRLPQVYETGIKEVIQLPEENFFSNSPVNDLHTMGYPIGLNVPGGGFLYKMKENRVAVGYLTGLCYEDPGTDPYEMFMAFKSHPFIFDIIKEGRVVEQGARTVSTGGYYTMPKLVLDGAVIIGGSAGIHNTPALKGIHVGMKSGMLAAEAIVEALEKKDVSGAALERYPALLDRSWVYPEIHEGRNFAAALAMKGMGKWIHLGAQYLSKGRGIKDPLPLEADSGTLRPLNVAPMQSADEGEFDGTLMVDKLTGVYLSKTTHREDQPCHLIIKDPNLCIETCYPTYGSPCTRFCPAKVYELETDETTKQARIKLNPSNCLHCKTCDVKDPYQNINWVCPEGGGGPGYTIA
jgi:electron-transferring-flavoprotein dehydrogenase